MGLLLNGLGRLIGIGGFPRPSRRLAADHSGRVRLECLAKRVGPGTAPVDPDRQSLTVVVAEIARLRPRDGSDRSHRGSGLP